VTRRSLLRGLFAAPILGTIVPKPGMAQVGFAVTGPLTATSTEQSEGYAQLGNVLLIAVNPTHKELYPRLVDMIGKEVRIEVAPV
jgi:hypothetical protein